MASSQFFEGDPNVAQGMTSQEVEDVMALWAQRQQHGASFGGTSVESVAEALNARPGEIESLLREVRSQAIPHEPPKRRWGTALLIAGAVLGSLFLTFTIGWNAGHNKGLHSAQFLTPDFAPMPPSPPPLVGDLAFLNIDPITPPEGVTVSFDGKYVVGKNTPGLEHVTFAERMEVSLQKLVEEMQPMQTPPTTGYFPEVLRTALLGNSVPEELKSVLVFRSAQVQFRDVTAAKEIPVALTTDPMLNEMVRNEQLRRIRQLASVVALSEDQPVSAPSAR